METITVIIPTHNYGLYIAETLDSLLQQTYPNWECLIIDDGSTDNTQEVVSTYTATDNRFRYIYQSCQGVSAARNAGLTQASGTYIQFLDADDLLLNKKLEVHIAYLRQHPTIDIVYSDVRYFLTDDKSKLSRSFDMTDTEWLPKVDDTPSSVFWHLTQRNIMPIQSPLSRATLLHKVGLFNATMRYCEDWDYWVRCAIMGGKIRFLDTPDAISLVRVHRLSASQNTDAMAVAGQLIAEKLVNYLQNSFTTVNKRLQADIKRREALYLIKNQQYAKGLILFLRTAILAHNNRVSAKDIAHFIKVTAFPKERF